MSLCTEAQTSPLLLRSKPLLLRLLLSGEGNGEGLLTEAEQIASWGQSMDVRVLLRVLLAELVTTLASAVAGKERLVMHSWFNGKLFLSGE